MATSIRLEVQLGAGGGVGNNTVKLMQTLINALNDRDRTALHEAAEKGNLDLIKLLVDPIRKADVDLLADGKTAADLARDNKRLPAMAYLTSLAKLRPLLEKVRESQQRYDELRARLGEGKARQQAIDAEIAKLEHEQRG
jgi:ankyrin repeat protein